MMSLEGASIPASQEVWIHFLLWRMPLPGVTSHSLLGEVGLESISFKLPKVSRASSELAGFDEEMNISRPSIVFTYLEPRVAQGCADRGCLLCFLFHDKEARWFAESSHCFLGVPYGQ